MNESNPNIRRKAEEDEFRNIDSIRPARKANPPITPDSDTTLPKTRRQRRLEQQGGITVSVVPETPELSAREQALKKKAKAFSQMVFNDDSLDPENFSSLSMVPEGDELPVKKRWWGKKSTLEPAEELDIHALDGHVNGLLVRFLRDYKSSS